MATYKVILAFLALGLLCTGTTCGADASTENAPQIATMEEFQREDWGNFWTVDFQGERLFAAYAEGGYLWANSKDFDLTKHDHLSRVLIDDVEDRVFYTGTPLELEEGYELVIGSVDLDGNRVYVELFKDGLIVDSGLVCTDGDAYGKEATLDDLTYTYARDVGESQGIVIIAVHFKNAFRGADRDAATFDGIWQISETPIEIGNGEIQIPQWRNFQLDEWGHFWAVDSLRMVRFAAYAEDGCLYGISKDPDLAKHNLTSRVLIDDVEDHVLTTPDHLRLEEGYELVIEAIDLDGNKVYVELLKGGKVVDAAVIKVETPCATVKDKTYTYTRDLGDAEDVVVIAVHFKNSFRGAERDVAIVDGIWQISETPINV
jgi:S-layer protein (TIGR01567 family)